MTDSIKVMTGGYGYTTIDDMDAKIDAARLEGIRLGLEAAMKTVCSAEVKAAPEAEVGIDSLESGRFAGLAQATDLILALNPDTIARDVQTISHQEKCDNLHIAREAQDMGSDTSAGTTA